MVAEERKRLEATSWLAVVRAYQACSRRYAQMLSHFDLTAAQFDALSAIHRLSPDATPKGIAREMLVTRGNVTGLIQRLCDRSLVSTSRHDRDGRSFRCEMTPRGSAVFAEAGAAAARFVAGQLAPFDDGELRSTLALMTRMEAHVHNIDPAKIARKPQTESLEDQQ